MGRKTAAQIAAQAAALVDDEWPLGMRVEVEMPWGSERGVFLFNDGKWIHWRSDEGVVHATLSKYVSPTS